MKLTLTNKIIIGFILGLVLGEFFFLSFSPEVSHDLGAKVQIVSKIFLRLIKMIVGP
jgi:Na+/H+-dicarboxylate symporter